MGFQLTALSAKKKTAKQDATEAQMKNVILHLPDKKIHRPGHIRLSDAVSSMSRTVKTFVDADHAVIDDGGSDAFLHLVLRYGRELAALPIDPVTDAFLRDMYWRLRFECMPAMHDRLKNLAPPDVRWHHIGRVPGNHPLGVTWKKVIKQFDVPCSTRHRTAIVIPGQTPSVETVTLFAAHIDIHIVDGPTYFDRIWIGRCERCGLGHWTDLVTDQHERAKAIPLYDAWRRNNAKAMLAEFAAIRDGKATGQAQHDARKHASRIRLDS